MKATHLTGLGHPEVSGKKSLFQPPREKDERENGGDPDIKKVIPKSRQRIRTTIELSAKALEVIQQIQARHRLETGRVLPLWKLVSAALEKIGATSENKIPGASHAQT